MSVSATQIQLLRSSIPNFRPDPAQLLDGQPAVNIAAQQPGLFFKDNNGNLVKFGPVTVGATAPNTAALGTPGNSVGELWFDINDQALKVWDGFTWRRADPAEISYSRVIIQVSPPPLDLYPAGALWWNDGNGELFVLYEDTNGRQWVQVGGGGGGSGGAVLISEQQPDPAVTSAGALWWNDATGSLYILYNDGGPVKLWVQIAGAGSINGGNGGSVTSVNAGTGLSTLTGQPITTQGTIYLKPATSTEIGGIKPGSGVQVLPDGTLNVTAPGSGTVTQIATGPGITGGPITTVGTIGLASATPTQIGGTKPGVGLNVTGDGTIFATPATNGQLGSVVVGEGLSVSGSGVLSVNAVPPGFIPAGMIQFFAGNLATMPAGWLYCDGSIYNIDTYPTLYAAIQRIYTSSGVPSNQFQVPDMRGLFPRGWDNRSTGGFDNNRVFGSYQADELKSHTHQYYDNLGPGYGLTVTGNSAEQLSDTSATGGAETRPKNIAILPIIRT